MENKNSSILVVAYLYGDEVGTASVRSTQLSLQFLRYFKNVHVITKDNILHSDKVNISTVNIESLKEFVKKTNTSKRVDEKTKKSYWLECLIKLSISFPTNLVLSESNIPYVYKAVKIASKLIEDNKITHIYSSKRPYGDHYICYILKKKYPNLKWIADFRDLYIDPVYNTVYLPSFQKKIEQIILNKADIVTTVSNGLVKHLQVYGRPTYNIMRGMKIRETLPYFDKFTINYTGSLFQNFRDPRPVFKVLSLLIGSGNINRSDIRIIYAGKDQALFREWIDEYNLSDIFEGKGLITRDEAQTLQSKSHINLLLSSSTPEWQGVLTGKVFEYIESCNTTLCLIQGVEDKEFEDLFEDLNAGVVVYSPEIHHGRMSSFILDNYNEWKNTGTLSKKVNTAKIIENHSWNSRAQQILKLV